MRLLVWLQRLFDLERWQFPTAEPRGRVHFDGERTTAELMTALKPGRQPRPKR